MTSVGFGPEEWVIIAFVYNAPSGGKQASLKRHSYLLGVQFYMHRAIGVGFSEGEEV